MAGGLLLLHLPELGLDQARRRARRGARAEWGKIAGRNYRRADLPIINALAAATGFGAAVVLALYIKSPDVRLLYRHPDALWGISMVLIYWLGRVCLLTGRNEMRQDPVIFAATDPITWKAGVLVAAIFLVAI